MSFWVVTTVMCLALLTFLIAVLVTCSSTLDEIAGHLKEIAETNAKRLEREKMRGG